MLKQRMVIRAANYWHTVTKMKEDLIKEIELKEGVSAELVGGTLIIKGKQGEVKRNFTHPKVEIIIESGKIVLKATKATKRERTLVGSFAAHIKNMIKGVQEPFVYKLKICSGHFPMNVKISGQEVTIKNFIGESVPRKVILLPGTKVKIEGTEIVISGPDKELAGKNAGMIERLCRITNRDKRIFQDGCYITEKAGKKV